MQVLVEGHTYVAEGFNGNPKGNQIIQFIHKEPVEIGSVELETVMEGTTNEEVIKVLINRLEFLNTKFPCEENERAIENLKASLNALEERTLKRVQAGIEGKNIK